LRRLAVRFYRDNEARIRHWGIGTLQSDVAEPLGAGRRCNAVCEPGMPLHDDGEIGQRLHHPLGIVFKGPEGLRQFPRLWVSLSSRGILDESRFAQVVDDLSKCYGRAEIGGTAFQVTQRIFTVEARNQPGQDERRTFAREERNLIEIPSHLPAPLIGGSDEDPAS
jgi:hypothetical protein